MKTALAIAASLVVNASMVIAFERSALEAMPVPAGEVIVTELGDVAVTLAHVSLPSENQAQPL